MLSNQAKLHHLLAKQAPNKKEREEVLKLIRNGRYDLPACAFENAFELLKANSSANQSIPKALLRVLSHQRPHSFWSVAEHRQQAKGLPLEVQAGTGRSPLHSQTHCSH